MYKYNKSLEENNNNNLDIKDKKSNKIILSEFITNLKMYLIENGDLNSRDMSKLRKESLSYADKILNEWPSFESELNLLGCNLKYPYKLRHEDACYYVIQQILDFLKNQINDKLIPNNFKNRLQLIYPKQYEPEHTGNNLDIGKYLIDDYLADCLIYGNSCNKIEKKNISKEFFYVVVLNKLWNSKENRYTLVYNYIKYNKIFFNLYHSYATLEQRYVTSNKQNNLGAGYFFLLDSKLDPKFNSENESSEYEVFRNYRSDIINKHKDNSYIYLTSSDFIEICKIITIKLLTSLSLQDMSIIIAYLAESSRMDIEPKVAVTSILQKTNEYSSIEADNIRARLCDVWYDSTGKSLYNDLSRFIFIVSDVRDLINCIKKSSIYTDTNPGPVKERGGHSMIGNILYEFDSNFRNSMYNHYKLYYYNNNGDITRLRFDNFGYKNIHCNLGYSKW